MERSERGAGTIRGDRAFWVLVLVGLIACVVALGTKPLSTDEGTSYFLARLDAGRLWHSLWTSEANGSPFYGLLHLWVALGDSELVLRILPALFGLATVPVVYAIGKRLDGKRLDGKHVAVGATLLMSVDLYFISHAQELRSYSLALLLSAVATLLFVRNVQEGSTTGPWILYAVVAALAVYAHFFSAFVVLSHAIALFTSERRKEKLRAPAVAAVILAVLVSPLIYFVVARDVGQVDWIPAPSPSGLVEILQAMSGTIVPGALVLPLGLMVFGIYKSFTTSYATPRWQAVLVVGWALIPFFGALLISLFKPLLLARYVVVSVPAMTLLMARGLFGLQNKGIRVAVALLTGAVLLQASVSWYLRDGTDQDWRAYAAVVRNNTAAGDGVFFYAPTIIRPFGYYAGYYRDTGKAGVPPPLYPDKYWLGYSKTRFNPDLERIATSVRKHDRVWLVQAKSAVNPRRAELARLTEIIANTCTGEIRSYEGGSITLYSGCEIDR